MLFQSVSITVLKGQFTQSTDNILYIDCFFLVNLYFNASLQIIGRDYEISTIIEVNRMDALDV